MKPLNPHSSTGRTGALQLEAYLDGALAPEEAARLEARLTADDELAADLAFARAVQDELRLMPQPACPPEVTRAVLAETRRLAERSPGARWAARWAAWSARWRAWSERFVRPLWQPALALASVVVLAVVLWRPAPPPADEVAQAMDDVKWALAYLSEVGRQTGQQVRNDVLQARMVDPMQNVLDVIVEAPSSEQATRPPR